MTETKTKIREVFVNILSLLFVSQPVVAYRENASATQPTAVCTAYCVTASNSVFSNIVIRCLV